MTPDPIIVSIPHTGTRFLKERLGLEDHVHTHMNWVAISERIQGRKIIAPLRSPSAVWRSWCRRRMGTLEQFPILEFASCWYIMHTIEQMYEVDFIKMEGQADSRITDWTPVGDSDTGASEWRLHKVDLRALYKLPFVQRHYGSWA